MTILVGYPTNRRAKAVLSLAGMLARSGGEDVVVCLVAVDPRIPGVARDPGFRSYVDVLADKAETQAREDMPKDVPARFIRFEARSVPSGLVQAAEQYVASTIVVGSAMGPIEKVTLSSFADRLLYSSPVPVAVAIRGFRTVGNVKRVTLAFSGGEQGSVQVAAAGKLADHFGAELRLASFAVHMTPPDVLRDHLEYSTVLDQWNIGMRAAAADAIKADGTTDRRDPELVIGKGENWEDAIDDIDWSPGDLMVIGSSEAGPISRVFLGSGAAKIVRHSPVPVLAIPLAAARNLAEDGQK
jgi:nucleotide-binding universal stress UspA family protein